MNLYNLNELFEVNNELEFDLITETWGNYIHVKDFFKFPSNIIQYIKNSPCIKTPNFYEEINGKYYFDGRSHIIFPHLPRFSEVCFHLMKTNFHLNTNVGLKFDNPFMVICNHFKLYNNKFNKYKTHNFCPHVDGNNTIACIWYFNENYSSDEGTGIYDKVNTNAENPWSNKEKLLGKVPAIYNNLIIYRGDIPHAQIVTDRWINETRISMVQFFTLNN